MRHLSSGKSAVMAACVALGCGGSGRTDRIDLQVGSIVPRAVDAIAASRGPESPASLVASLLHDRVCPRGSIDERVRCHLRAPLATIEIARLDGGWVVLLVMPQLSDHVHRAWLHRRRDGAVIVEVESQN